MDDDSDNSDEDIELEELPAGEVQDSALDEEEDASASRKDSGEDISAAVSLMLSEEVEEPVVEVIQEEEVEDEESESSGSEKSSDEDSKKKSATLTDFSSEEDALAIIELINYYDTHPGMERVDKTMNKLKNIRDFSEWAASKEATEIFVDIVSPVVSDEDVSEVSEEKMSEDDMSSLLDKEVVSDWLDDSRLRKFQLEVNIETPRFDSDSERIIASNPRQHFIEQRKQRAAKIYEKVLSLGEPMTFEKIPTIEKTAVIFMTEPYDPDVPNPYVEALKEGGLTTYLLPTVSCDILDLMYLKKIIKAPELYAGLILSSIRGYQAIKMHLPEKDEEFEKVVRSWRKKQHFILHQSTADKAIAELGLENIAGCGVGSLENMAEVIVNATKPEAYKEYVYPCSVFADNHFIKKMPEVKVCLICCYKPIAEPTLTEDWRKIVEENKGLPEFLIFFNPSAIYIAGLMLHEEKTVLQSFKVVTYGRSSEILLKLYRVKPTFIPKEPTPASFADGFHKYMNPFPSA